MAACQEKQTCKPCNKKADCLVRSLESVVIRESFPISRWHAWQSGVLMGLSGSDVERLLQ